MPDNGTFDPFDFVDSLDLGDSPPSNGHGHESSNGHAATAVMEPPATRNTAPASKPTAKPAAASPRGKQPLYIDIETIPDESRRDLFNLDPIPFVGPRTPAVDMMEVDALRSSSLDEIRQVLRSKRPDDQYLAALDAAERADPDKRKGNRKGLFEAIDELRGESQKIAEAAEAQRKTMSTTPEMCRIVSLAWAIGGDPVSFMIVDQPTADGRGVVTEVDLLDRFWMLLNNAGGPVVGYNVLGFDLPVLFVRSILLGIESPLAKRLDMKPWGADVIDLMAARFPKSQPKRLKDLARMMGIPVAAEADGVDGSQVEELFRTDPAKLGEYNRSDVMLTRELHRKYQGFFCA